MKALRPSVKRRSCCSATCSPQSVRAALREAWRLMKAMREVYAESASENAKTQAVWQRRERALARHIRVLTEILNQ